MRLAHPELLFLLLLLPILAGYHFRVWPFRRKPVTGLVFSRAGRLKHLPGGVSHARHWLFLIRSMGLLLLLLGLARPQMATGYLEEEIEGIDIMLTLDISGSMAALDMDPNYDPRLFQTFFMNERQLQRLKMTRLEAAKQVAEEFVRGRRFDRIGLVSFAELDQTRCPLTADRETVARIISELDFAPLEQSGTAIGDALVRSLQRLLRSEAESKVIILLTDGEDNRSRFHPNTAAQMAASLDPPVRIHCIGVGRYEQVPFRDPRTGQFGWISAGFDENSMKQIAETSGGRYFHAADLESLKRIFEEIDRLEKTILPDQAVFIYREIFAFLTLPALVLLLLEVLLGTTVWRQFP